MRRAAALLLALAGLLPTGVLAEGRVAVAAAHPLATEAGLDVLAAGGNAFDAAVAVSAALAVVEPTGSGLGGGGFWLLGEGDTGRTVMVDGRETAPGAATADMYRDAGDRASLDGPLAAGIPGEPAALAHISRRYGDLPLSRALAPAIRLAREGFRIGQDYRGKARFRQDVLRQSPAAAGIFLADGAVPPAGHVLRQPELAATLERLAEHGRDGFYRGETARRLVEGVRAAGGIWTLEDLRDYRVMERAPVTVEYGDYTVTAASLPSAGGIGLATMLQILDGAGYGGMGPVARIHWSVEAMRCAYRDRARYLGDPGFVDVPVARLTSRAYADRLRRTIEPQAATPSGELPADAVGRDTTHFSVRDAAGNRVAATLSINYPFGSGFVPPGTGVLLNDEMDDFATDPGSANVYGLVGGEANAIAPGKRPLSSMTPTFVDGPARSAILGTPGGSRIITMVLLGVLEFADGGRAADMVKRPRYHHQYRPDHIQHEPDAFSEAERDALADMGHSLKARDRTYGDMQVIVHDRDADRLEAASDPRGIGRGIVRTLEPAPEPAAAPATP